MNTKHESASTTCISPILLFILRMLYGRTPIDRDGSNGPGNIIY